jgi:hypothetical protein
VSIWKLDEEGNEEKGFPTAYDIKFLRRELFQDRKNCAKSI